MCIRDREKPADKPLTDLQKKAVEIADRYKDLPLTVRVQESALLLSLIHIYQSHLRLYWRC